MRTLQIRRPSGKNSKILMFYGNENTLEKPPEPTNLRMRSRICQAQKKAPPQRKHLNLKAQSKTVGIFCL